MIVVVMGVSGVGKTTVGRLLAKRLGWPFLEADSLHPVSNVQKMASGHPLDDHDRAPWLDAIAERMAEWHDGASNGVVACSALRRAYRDRLARGLEDVRFVHLAAPREEVAARLVHRHGHYMPASLLDSQYATLEQPDSDEGRPVLTLDAMDPAEDLAAQAAEWIAGTSR